MLAKKDVRIKGIDIFKVFGTGPGLLSSDMEELVRIHQESRTTTESWLHLLLTRILRLTVPQELEAAAPSSKTLPLSSFLGGL